MSPCLEEVLNPTRLAALRRTGLLDTPAEAVFDNLGQLATKLLNAPVALVTLVDANRQFFKSCLGLPEPWATWRESPLSHSFCQHVVGYGQPLIIRDAREDPRFLDNLAIPDFGVVAYLGVPLLLSGGHLLGTFCVIDHKPRDWTLNEIHTLQVLAQSVITELELRSEIKNKERALAQLQAANEELEAFSYTVSHDLKSPLRAVTGFSELLQEQCQAGLSPECKKYLEIINIGSARMASLIDGLLVLARIGKSVLSITDVSIDKLADDIISDLRAGDPQRNVEIKVQSPLPAKGDARLLRQVMENLLRNAWKFTAGKPVTRIEVGAREAKGERLFFVKDNGTGFDERQAARLFKPFQRLHGAEFPGSGIGLATVKRIIDRHRGRVCAEPNPEGGAIFYFTLPDVPVD